jgi:hypothetical protein
MATAIGGRPIEMELKLWHGVSPVALTALSISVVTLTAGFLPVHALRDGSRPSGPTVVARLGRVGPARGYDLALAGLLAGAGHHATHADRQPAPVRAHRPARAARRHVSIPSAGRLRLDALPVQAPGTGTKLCCSR